MKESTRGSVSSWVRFGSSAWKTLRRSTLHFGPAVPRCLDRAKSGVHAGLMNRILLQTTIPYAEDDWHVGRFSLLQKELESAGTVVARNREPDANGDDPVLSSLDTADFDEVWLMAVDNGDGLSARDAAGLTHFRERGGGVCTARDHQDLGCSLCELGSIGKINHFHTHNPEADSTRYTDDDKDNPNITYPNYHSGANGDYQPVTPLEPVHEVLRSERSRTGAIEFFPAHPHEGAVNAEPAVKGSRAIATGRSSVTGRPFALAVIIEGETDDAGKALGNVLAASSFHHFADFNWDPDKGCPSFVRDKPGHQIKDDPSRLEIFKDYVRNAARWLAGSSVRV